MHNLSFDLRITFLQIVCFSLSCISSVSECSSNNFSLQRALTTFVDTSEVENSHAAGPSGNGDGSHSQQSHHSHREQTHLTRAQLISGLDLLLNCTAEYQAFNFTGVYELKGQTPLSIIQSCQQAAMSQLSSATFLLWIQQTTRSVLALPGDECQPLVRRVIVATIVKQWLAAETLTQEEALQATALLGQVRPSF